MQLVLATNNDHKAAEMRAELADLPVELLSRTDFPHFPDPDESGSTLEANATIKALAVREQTGLPSLADDSGLFVDALEGAPGVYSSRFAGERASHADNCRKLLRLLEAVPQQARTAHFRCVMAIAWDSSDVELLTGRCDGLISTDLDGTQGFGYDPLFFYPPAGRRFSQLTLSEKNAVSHRGRALVLVRRQIVTRLARIAAK